MPCVQERSSEWKFAGHDSGRLRTYVRVHEETGVPHYDVGERLLSQGCHGCTEYGQTRYVRRIDHGQGGYEHDLQGCCSTTGKRPITQGVEFGEKGQRSKVANQSLCKNAMANSTRHMAWVPATMFDINRGNRMVRLTSMASKSRACTNTLWNMKRVGP